MYLGIKSCWLILVNASWHCKGFEGCTFCIHVRIAPSIGWNSAIPLNQFAIGWDGGWWHFGQHVWATSAVRVTRGWHGSFFLVYVACKSRGGVGGGGGVLESGWACLDHKKGFFFCLLCFIISSQCYMTWDTWECRYILTNAPISTVALGQRHNIILMPDKKYICPINESL